TANVVHRSFTPLATTVLRQRANCKRRRDQNGGPANTHANPSLFSRSRHFASGSGRSWKCTASGFEPLPFSINHGARSPLELHNPRPFQPAFGSSIRPSKPLA